MRISHLIAGVVFTALAFAAAVAPAAGQQSFLEGQTVELMSDATPGSADVLLLQEFAKALERIVPGLRVIVRENPGGSPALTAALIDEAAPDGFVIGTSDADSITARLNGDNIIDITQFAIIGSISRISGLMLASTGSGITSAADLIASDPPPLFAARSVNSGIYLRALLLNALLGSRIRPVTGYDNAARMLAFLNNESQLLFPGGDADRLIAEGAGVPIFTVSQGEIYLDDDRVPELADLEISSPFPWIVDYFETASAARHLVVSRSIAPERLADWRRALLAAAADPEFLAAMEGFAVIDPVPGDLAQQRIDRLLAAIGPDGEEMRRALACGQQLADTGQACIP